MLQQRTRPTGRVLTHLYLSHSEFNSQMRVCKCNLTPLILLYFQVNEQSNESIVKLLKTLLHTDEGHFNLKRAVESLEELSARSFGLSDEADIVQTENISR